MFQYILARKSNSVACFWHYIEQGIKLSQKLSVARTSLITSYTLNSMHYSLHVFDRFQDAGVQPFLFECVVDISRSRWVNFLCVFPNPFSIYYLSIFRGFLHIYIYIYILSFPKRLSSGNIYLYIYIDHVAIIIYGSTRG